MPLIAKSRLKLDRKYIAEGDDVPRNSLFLIKIKHEVWGNHC